MTGDAPLFSLVVPLTDPTFDLLLETVDSVLAQTVDEWELIVVDAAASGELTARLERLAARDRRIRVLEQPEHLGAAEAANAGIDAARGAFVAFVAPGGVLAPTALAANRSEIEEADDADFLYSDETRRNAEDDADDDIIKPEWSPERLRSQNYCGQLAVMRTDLVRAVGRFRPELGGAYDHDLVLRVTELARRVVHLPQILHRTRVPRSPSVSPATLEIGARVVQEHLDRVGIDGVAHAVAADHVRVVREFPAERTVSVVIPTRGSSAQVWGRRRVLVVDAVRSVLEFAYHPRMEIVVVYDSDTPATVLDQLREVAGDHLVLVHFTEPFNYSRKMNRGVLASTGERLILLNDDVEIRNPGWVRELLAPLEEPGVGATGAKLYFEDTSIQHAGLAWLNGNWDHPYRLFPGDTPGRGRMNLINREVSGVTGACTGIRRETYFEVGGLTEQLPLNFNDVDFCYKITARGYRILYMAQCELFHFESRTRERHVHKYERDFIISRWGRPDRDPYSPDYPEQPLSPADLRRRAEELELRRALAMRKTLLSRRPARAAGQVRSDS